MKPDVRYFQAVVAELALTPAEVLFIDDAERNVVAAREAGLRAARFVPASGHLPAAAMKELLEGFAVVADEPSA